MATSKKNIVEMKPDVSAQIETLRNDVAQLTETLKEQAKQTAQAKKIKVIDTASEKVAITKAKYEELTKSAETTIRENPLTSIAAAVGAGVVIGLLNRR